MKNLILSTIFLSLSAFAAPGITPGQVAPGLDAKSNYVKVPTPRAAGDVTALYNAVSSAALSVDLSTFKVDGFGSFACDASALNGYCEHKFDTIRDGDKSGQCSASMVYKGDATLYSLEIVNASGVVRSWGLDDASSAEKTVTLPVDCSSIPTSIRITQTTAGTAPAINYGRVKYFVDPLPDGTIVWPQRTVTGSEAPTIAAGSGTLPTNTQVWKMRRVGDTIFLSGRITWTGTNTWTSLRINTPTAFIVDQAKWSSLNNAGLPNVSMLTSSNVYYGRIIGVSATQLAISKLNVTSANINHVDISNSVPAAWAANDFIDVEFSYPVQGWDVGAAIQQNTLDVLGSIFYVPTATCPAGSEIADGGTMVGQQYAALIARLGTAVKPDLRGIFVRGAGSQTISGQTFTGVLGAYQLDQFESHTHTMNRELAGGGTPGVFAGAVVNDNRTQQSASVTATVQATGGTETNPANISLTPCISYATTPAPVIPNSVKSANPTETWIEWASISCTGSSSASFKSSDWLTISNATDHGAQRSCAITFTNAFTERPGCQVTPIIGGVGAPTPISIFNASNGGFEIAGPDFDFYGMVTCAGKR